MDYNNAAEKFMIGFYVLMIFSVNQSISITTDRDIILSPNKSIFQPGKILYYHPTPENITNTITPKPTQVPWEDALKHSVFLSLRERERTQLSTHSKRHHQPHENITNGSINVADLHRAIKNANYIPAQTVDDVPMFGDIITVARGKLELNDENGEFNLVQTNSFKCERLCDEDAENFGGNVTALWMVEKVRHRDPNRGHRYEMRITIMPINKRKERTSKEIHFEKRIGRSFILRDNDYPKYFKVPMLPPQPTTLMKVYKKSDIDRTFTLDFGGGGHQIPRQQYPFALNYRPELNVGEFYMRPPTIIPSNYMPQIQTFPNQFYQFNTPNYFKLDPLKNYNHFPETTQQIRFPESSTLLTNKITELNSPLTATQHLHHHFYLNKMNVPLIKATTVENEYNSKFIGDHRGTTTDHYREPYKFITPVVQNDIKTQQPDFNNYQTPQVFPNQIPAPNGYYKTHFSNHITHSQYPTGNQQPTPIYNAHQQPVTIGQYTQPLQIPPNPLQAPQFRPLSETSPKYRAESPHLNRIVPFHESEKFETNRYSDPDPLYHPEQETTDTKSATGSSSERYENKDQKNNQQEGFDVITTKVKPTQTRYNHEKRTQNVRTRPSSRFPDSINAQLPPPEKGTDTNVPYVESSVVTQKSESPPLIIVPSISVNSYPPTASSAPIPLKQTADPRSSTATKTVDKIKIRSKSSNLREHFRTTTEKPIIKWMPKRRRVQSPPTTNATRTVTTKIYSSRIPQFDATKVENYITVQPIASSTTRSTNDIRPPTISTKLNTRLRKSEKHKNVEQIEPTFGVEATEMAPTKQSVITSVSIEIGNNTNRNNTRRRLFDELRPRLKLKTGKENGDDADETKVEMVKADIQTLKTNSTGMHLFRASDEMTDGDGDADSDPIAASILKHAKLVTENNNRRLYRRPL